MPRRRVQVRIGSKNFTESVILGEMLRLLVGGGRVGGGHYREFGGTRIVFDALVAGEIDAYPEYTGTITQKFWQAKTCPTRRRCGDYWRSWRGNVRHRSASAIPMPWR